ncbi:hypothetical protein Ddc_21488 [Ditylenchus destructor]|nr:hypothetical protein Ddc_21488 [Ditylenchus destructor]
MFSSSKVLSVCVFATVLVALGPFGASRRVQPFWSANPFPGKVPSVAPPAVPSLPSIPSLNVTLPPLPTGVPDAGELEKLIEALIALIQALLSGAVPTGVPTAVPSVGVPSA